MVETDIVDQTGELTEFSKRQILEDAGLFNNDPTSFPNLSPVLDPKAGLDHSFRPVAYNTAVSTQEMVRCSICEQRQFHNHGFIVRITTGEIGLVGRDCGERYFFGEDGWRRVEADSRVASERALFERRWGPAKAALEKVIPHALSWGTQLYAVRQLQLDFKAELPELHSAIAAKQHDGKLSIETRLEVPYETPSGERHVKIEYVPTIVCDVGAAWFFTGTDLHQIFLYQVRALQSCVTELSADMESKAVVILTKKLREIRINLQDIATQQSMLPRLFNSST